MLSMASVNANIIIMWNGTQASIPSGWSCVSCSAGVDPFTFLGIETDATGVYPRIGNNYCPSDGEIQCGGNPSHSHIYTTISGTTGLAVNREPGFPNGFNTASMSHYHNSLNVSSTLSNISLPRSYVLLFIRANSQSETRIPSGGIIWFNGTSAPSGFTMFTNADGYFPIAGINGTQNTIIGNATHTHLNHTVRTGNPVSAAVTTIGSAQVATNTHTHIVGSIGWSQAGDQSPPFVDVPLIYATTDTNFPVGMIGMFNDTTLDSNWMKWNSTDVLGRYLRANSTNFNTTGGNATHTHNPKQTFTTLGGNATRNAGTGSTNYPQGGHTHQINITANPANNLPQYTNVTMFILTSPIANETEGRSAIEQGIYNATPSATIYTDLEVDIRYFNGTQKNGVFDKVSFNGTQRWGFNYVTGSESFTNMANSSYEVFNAWEDDTLTFSQIFDAVRNFITNTL